jgi:sulfotransferase family protein
MKIIGAGLMRTGTMSMQAALGALGYPCYHMVEVFRQAGHLDTWQKFVAGQAAMDWNALFARFEATVDTPACLFYRELMQEFPDAKVILTVRDPERWYESFAALPRVVDGLRPLERWIPKLGKAIRFVDAVFDNTFAGPLERGNCIRAFTAHNEAVQRFVPPERLLVFRVTDGWEPLCAFLGCAVPQGAPFPHLNEGDETIKALAREIFVGPWMRTLALLAGGLALALTAWWLA